MTVTTQLTNTLVVIRKIVIVPSNRRNPSLPRTPLSRPQPTLFFKEPGTDLANGPLCVPHQEIILNPIPLGSKGISFCRKTTYRDHREAWGVPRRKFTGITFRTLLVGCISLPLCLGGDSPSRRLGAESTKYSPPEFTPGGGSSFLSCG